MMNLSVFGRHWSKLKTLGLTIIFFTAFNSWATIEVAITVDDLPQSNASNRPVDWLAVSNKMLSAFKKHQVQGVYGFVNSNPLLKNRSLTPVLENWVKAGHFLGNHTFSHADLDKLSVSDYMHEITANEETLQSIMGTHNYKFFRYPYLAEGETQEKRDGIRNFLFHSGYALAPVSMDFFDYEWSAPYLRCIRKTDHENMKWLRDSYIEQAVYGMEIARLLSSLIFNRDIKYILLIHIGTIQSDALDSLLTAFESKGVKFIGLPEALSDEAYKFDPKIARNRSYTFLNQMRLSRKLQNPKRVSELYNLLPEEKLGSICR